MKKSSRNNSKIAFYSCYFIFQVFGFQLARINGSHHIYNREDILEIINICHHDFGILSNKELSLLHFNANKDSAKAQQQTWSRK